MNKIVRQTPELKLAIEAIIARNTQKTMDIICQVSPDRVTRNSSAFIPKSSIINTFGSFSKGRNNEDRIDLNTMIVNDFVGRTKEARDNTVIIPPCNADRTFLNRSIHAVMQSKEMLGKSTRIPVLQLINHQEADLKDTHF